MLSVTQSVREFTLTHPLAVKFIGLVNERFSYRSCILTQYNQKYVNIEVMLFHDNKVTEFSANLFYLGFC